MMNRFVVEDSLRKDGGAIGEKKPFEGRGRVQF